MEFCTVQDLEENLSLAALIQLSDDRAQGVQEEVCREVIAQASELIIGHLAGRYSDLSALKPTPLLKRIALDICAYYLYSRRNKGNIDNIRKRYEEALKELDYIKLGQLSPPAQERAAPVEYRTNKRRSQRLFPDDIWERF